MKRIGRRLLTYLNCKRISHAKAQRRKEYRRNSTRLEQKIAERTELWAVLRFLCFLLFKECICIWANLNYHLCALAPLREFLLIVYSFSHLLTQIKKPRRTPQGCCDGAGTEKRPVFPSEGIKKIRQSPSTNCGCLSPGRHCPKRLVPLTMIPVSLVMSIVCPKKLRSFSQPRDPATLVLAAMQVRTSSPL